MIFIFLLFQFYFLSMNMCITITYDVHFMLGASINTNILNNWYICHLIYFIFDRLVSYAIDKPNLSFIIYQTYESTRAHALFVIVHGLFNLYLFVPKYYFASTSSSTYDS